MDFDDSMASLLRGALMVLATGVIQVLAQLVLNHMLALPRPHRMVGAIEAAAGMMMFGWSTALLVSVVQRTNRRPRA